MINNNFIQFSKQDLKIAFDVGKDSLDSYYRLPNPEQKNGYWENTDKLKNTPNSILKLLAEIKNIADQYGYKNVKIVCEPTGIYHRPLLRAAFKLKMNITLVSGDATHKGKSLAGNTRNKTDEYDPKVIYIVSEFAPEITCRDTLDEYDALRDRGRTHAQLKEAIKIVKIELKDSIFRLFPTFKFCKEFYEGPSAKAISALYNFNPALIVKDGKELFFEKYKKQVKGVRKATMLRVWESAIESNSLSLKPLLADAHAAKIRYLYEDLEKNKKRISETMIEMIKLLYALRKLGEPIPVENKALFSDEWIALILAETGSISDFQSFNQLQNFAGLNLRENKSGIRTGQVRTDKKGSPFLRHILSKLAFKVCKKTFCYGEYYHGRKEDGAMGIKMMTSVARKIFKAFYGMAKSKSSFDQLRLQMCQSKYNLAIAS